MGKRGTVVADLREEPGISSQTLYRRVSPTGELRATEGNSFRMLCGKDHAQDHAPSKRTCKGCSLTRELPAQTQKKEESMNLQWRDSLLVFTVAAAVATPAFGQAVAPTAGSADSGKGSAAPIPDFSGIWLHSNGYEPLPSGPTSLVNRSRRPDGAGNGLQLVGDYTNPILKPEAAEVVKRHGEIALKGIGDPTPRNQCWPGGVPFVFPSGTTQLIQQPDKVTILYGYDHQVRHVRMNQSHPSQVTPSWYGDSVGHYEGDALVIDTVGIKIGPFAMVDWYGTPHTEALHVVEHYRLLDYNAAKEGFERDAKERIVAEGMRNPNHQGRSLQLQFTVEDKGVFTTQWTATMTYGFGPADWLEQVCAENIQWYSGKNAEVPQAAKPDF
jgi:hypothetical protein